jgi:hypothetical protein
MGGMGGMSGISGMGMDYPIYGMYGSYGGMSAMPRTSYSQIGSLDDFGLNYGGFSGNLGSSTIMMPVT